MFHRLRQHFPVPALFFLWALAACTPDLELPEYTAGDANFSKFIAVGGSYMTGFQDGALWKKGQERSIGALMAGQFSKVGGGSFRQPLMPDHLGLGLNAKPWEGVFVHASRLGYKTDCEGISALKPLKDTFGLSLASPYLDGISGNSFQNLAVPYARIQDHFSLSFSASWQNGNPNPYYHRFASNVGNSTVKGDAVAQQATFFAAWFGMEEIYEHARSGATSFTIPSGSVFWHYLDQYLGALCANGAKGVIANIPDPSAIPFYTTIPWNGLELTQSKADSLNQLTGYMFNFVAGQNGFVIADPDSPGNYRKMIEGEYLLLTLPLDSVKCNYMGVFTPIPDRYVLDISEMNTLRSFLQHYNSVINERASYYGLALCDMHSFFSGLKSGTMWNGVELNSTFVSGGFFSLDGYHPHQKGYAVLANEFVKSVCRKYNAVIPGVYCSDCDGVIFP
ncbi:MAG: hypothetical protein IT233_06295 [Bacteroidia bacterium]|nr:hypothetical protein [Bacteroidia bacterium]